MNGERSQMVESTNVESDPERIRLHFAPGTRAVRVRWLLEEIGVPYQLNVVSLWRGAHKSETYLKIHPLGKVPALEIDSTIIFESLGICLYLADRFAGAELAPLMTDRVRRAEYCTWMAFSSGTLEPSILEQVRAKKAAEKGVAPIGLGPILTPFDRLASYMDRHLAARPFLLGERLTAADILNCSLMAWAQDLGLLEGHQFIKAWISNFAVRPAYSRATQDTELGRMR